MMDLYTLDTVYIVINTHENTVVRGVFSEHQQRCAYQGPWWSFPGLAHGAWRGQAEACPCGGFLEPAPTFRFYPIDI